MSNAKVSMSMAHESPIGYPGRVPQVSKSAAARSPVAASGLAFNARTEIECIAFVPGKRGQ